MSRRRKSQSSVLESANRLEQGEIEPRALSNVPFLSQWRLLLRMAVVPLIGTYIASFAIWQDRSGNVVTGLGTNGWGDLLLHVRASVFFAEQGGWPHESFLLDGQPVGYAFAADFISALLWKVGFSTAASFLIPTILLIAAFLCLFEWFVFKVTKSAPAAVLSTVLFLCFGGLSGWSILPELTPNTWANLRGLPHGITVWREANYAVLNPFVMMLHQRGYLLGFPLFIVLLYLSWRFLAEKSLNTLIFLVIAAILLPLFHPFTWVTFLLIFPSLMAWNIILGVQTFTKREIGLTVAALAVIGLAGFLIIKTLQPNAGASSLTWKPGWLASDTDWVFFWLKNIGLYGVLGAVAVRYFFSRNPSLAVLVLAGITPFVAANLFQFAPWDWDNTKIFAPVWIIMSIATGTLLVSLWEKNQLGWKAFCLLAVPVLVLSGGLEIARVLSYRSQPFTISTVADHSMGEAIRTKLNKDDVVLSEPEPSHPVFMYSGRPSFVAYEGWLWSQGWQGKYEQRMADKKIIYSGTEASRELIHKNHIAYIVIGPPELRAGANQGWFENNYPRLIQFADYTVYDVRQPKKRG